MEQYSERLKSLFEKIDAYNPILELWVPGLPATSGSKRAIPKQRLDGSLYSIVMPANERQKEWQASVAYAARQAFHELPTDKAVRLHCLFTFVRPKSHLLKNGELAKGRSLYAVGHKLGDLTKLVRAVEDALTGIVWLDDSQVIEQSNAKYYGLQGGVLVRVFEVTAGVT